MSPFSARGRTLAVLAALALVFAPIAPAVAATGPAAEVFTQTNQQRSWAGKSTLITDATLDAAAQAWAVYLAQTGTFVHSSAAWRDSMISGAGWHSSGENIAAGYSTPSAVMAGWMNSPGHATNILHSGYTGVGIGYATGGPYGHYWVQIFATRSTPPLPLGNAPTITASSGQYTAAATGWPAGATLSWSWNANGVRIPGATSNTFRPLVSEMGKSLTATVTASQAGYSPGSKTSAAVAVTGSVPVVDRIIGADRYSTAVNISVRGYPNGADVAYVASGADFPDALGAAPAATYAGGPLLITPSTSLHPTVAAELRRLAPDRIVLVGGIGAVNGTVLSALNTIAPTTRVSGADRYSTARAVIGEAFTSSSIAYLATGAGFADALSASAAAGAIAAPVVLVNGSAASVDAATIELLRSLGTTTVRIAGGTGAVTEAIAQQLRSSGFAVERLQGPDRFATGAAINAQVFTSGSSAFVASGMSFPDALAGAALAGASGAPLFITQPYCLATPVNQALTTLRPTNVTLLGGEGAVSAQVASFTRC